MKRILLVLVIIFSFASMVKAEKLMLSADKFFSWCKESGVPGYSILPAGLDSVIDDGVESLSAEFRVVDNAAKVLLIDVDDISLMEEHEANKTSPEIKLMKNIDIAGRKALYLELNDVDANSVVVTLPEVNAAMSLLSRPSLKENELISLVEKLDFNALVK